MPIFQFIGAAIGGGLVVAAVSIAWPMFTAEPRPEALNTVRDVVINTEAGQNFANTLGVTDDAAAQPVSLPSFAASAAQTVVTNVVTNTQNTVTTRIIESLAGQFNQLPKDKQEQFRQTICTSGAE